MEETLEALLEKLAGDMQFLEGPVWVPQDGGYLIFSDIAANKQIGTAGLRSCPGGSLRIVVSGLLNSS